MNAQFDMSSLPLNILGELMKMAKPHDPNATFRFVGGCVRDVVLNRIPKDFDIVTDTTADTLEKMGLENVGKHFPVYLYDSSIGHIEVAVARSEEKVGTGHKGFITTPTGNYEDDRVRRDLTMNAMMVDADGVLYGWEEGMKAITTKTMEQVSEKFAEDPLRVFRVARFAAQLGPDWTVCPRLLETMRKMQPELATLPPDRVREELKKVVVSKAPARFFEVLRASECLSPWFSEIGSWGRVMAAVQYGTKQGWEFDQFMIGIATAMEEPETFLTRLGFSAAVIKVPNFIQHYDLQLEDPRSFGIREMVGIINRSRGVLTLEQMLDCYLMDKHPDSTAFLLACHKAMKATDMTGVMGRSDAEDRLVASVAEVGKNWKQTQ